MDMKDNIAQPTKLDPPYPMSGWMRHLSLLVRIGTTIMNNTLEGATMRRPRNEKEPFQQNCWMY
jgi:hypothetical protein